MLLTVNQSFFLQLPSDIESSDQTSGVKIADFVSQNLAQFLMQLYCYNAQDDSKDIFHEIGIHRYVIQMLLADVRKEFS